MIQKTASYLRKIALELSPESCVVLWQIAKRLERTAQFGYDHYSPRWRTPISYPQTPVRTRRQRPSTQPNQRRPTNPRIRGGAPVDPRNYSKDPAVLAQQAQQLGLVPLDGRRWTSPHLRQLFNELRSGVADANGPIRAKLTRVTEAWPPTTRHSSPGHGNGQAADIIFDTMNLAEIRRVVQYIKQKGFSVLNEYEKNTKYKTGAHVHVDSTPLSGGSRVAFTE